MGGQDCEDVVGIGGVNAAVGCGVDGLVYCWSLCPNVCGGLPHHVCHVEVVVAGGPDHGDGAVGFGVEE